MRKPDAVHTLSNRFVNGLQETVKLWNGGPNSRGDGHVRQGANIFMAFIDANNDGRWTAGEWMGFSENGVENMQWGSADVSIVLQDKPAGYNRFSWEQDMAAIAAGLSQVNGTTLPGFGEAVLGSSPSIRPPAIWSRWSGPISPKWTEAGWSRPDVRRL
jgi:hypothetical protein